MKISRGKVFSLRTAGSAAKLFAELTEVSLVAGYQRRNKPVEPQTVKAAASGHPQEAEKGSISEADDHRKRLVASKRRLQQPLTLHETIFNFNYNMVSHITLDKRE